MAPRFSVLMPTHNRADVLGYAIRSVLWQTEQDFELLIVGDGCTDNTAEVVAAFDDPRIRWFDLPKAPNFGYANRNIALKQARGDLIAFVAHDDIVFDDHLALLAATLESAGAEWAYSRPLWVAVDGTVVVYPLSLDNGRDLDAFLTKYNSIPASCVVHRRSCFEKYGYWPEDAPACGDWLLWIRIIEGGGRTNFAHCREVTSLHFVADWRRARQPNDHEQRDGLHAKGWWPVVTQLGIPQGVSEQQVFFEAITAGGADWVRGLRKDACDAVDRVAWAAMRELIPQDSAQQDEIARLTKFAAHIGQRLAEAEGQLRALHASSSPGGSRRPCVPSSRRCCTGVEINRSFLAACKAGRRRQATRPPGRSTNGLDPHRLIYVSGRQESPGGSEGGAGHERATNTRDVFRWVSARLSGHVRHDLRGGRRAAGRGQG
jgi:hypothetical protein